jgi:hypothetical protein
LLFPLQLYTMSFICFNGKNSLDHLGLNGF